MNDIVVVGLIAALGLYLLSQLFSNPTQPPVITFIPVIQDSTPMQSGGCGPLLLATLLILGLFFLLGG
jgi:hypothetical protein